MATDDCGATSFNNLGTTFAGGNGQAGNMFDLTAANDLTVFGWDAHIGDNQSHTVEVYYIAGGWSGNENNGAAWTLLGSATVTGNGSGNPTFIPVGGLSIPAGSTYGIYLTLSDGSTEIDYSNGAQTYSDANLTIASGSGNAYPFGSTFTSNGGRDWNGTVYYGLGLGASGGGVTVAQTAGPASGSAFAVGTTTTIEYTATDASGNQSTCSFTVTVNDCEDPILCTAGGVVSNTYGSGTTGPIPPTGTSGVSTYTLNVPANVTIVDVNVLNLQGDHTWTGDLDIILTSPANTDVQLLDRRCSSDNDFDLNFDDSAPAGAPTCPLTSGNTFRPDNTSGETLADFNGENASGVWTLTIIDNVGGDSGNLNNWELEISYLDPSLIPQGDITTTVDAGQCGAVVTYTAPTGVDNCPGVVTTLTSGLASGSLFPVGTTTVTHTATDASGNSVSCSFDVTVVDNEAPSITCPGDVVLNNDPGQCGANYSYAPPAISDNCPGVVAINQGGLGAGAAFYPVGTTTEVWMAVDASGNTSVCSFTVTVNDTEDPTFSICPTDITVCNDAGSCDAIVTWNLPVLSDNCPNTSLALTQGLAPGSTFPLGTTSIEYTATDGAGNQATCSFTVTVNDCENPTITCPADITVPYDPGTCGAVVTFNDPTFADNCPGASLSQTNGQVSGSTFPIGTTTNSYTVTDAAGNMAMCSFTVTVTKPAPSAVILTSSPQSVCSGIGLQLDAQAVGSDYVGTWSGPAGATFTPSANSASVTVNGLHSSMTVGGFLTITWTVVDPCTGAAASTSIQVEVFPGVGAQVFETNPISCLGGNDGEASVFPQGGTAPFTYSWAHDPNAGQVATGLTAGTYHATIVDANGCTTTGSITLADGTAPCEVARCYLDDWSSPTPGYSVIIGGTFMRWAGGTAEWIEFNNGNISIKGTAFDPGNIGNFYVVDITLVNKQTYAQYGGTYAGGSPNFGSWEYYTIDASSTITDANNNVCTLSPDAALPRFQKGDGANTNDADHGVYGKATTSCPGINFEMSVDANCVVFGVQVAPVVMLEGPYDVNTGRMTDNLRSQGLIPTTEPYTGLPGFTHVNGGGGETVNPAVFTTTGDDAIIDWVFVELRDAANPSQVMATRSALLQADGDIVDVNNRSTVNFPNLLPGDYHVTVRHRNHLGIMTLGTITLSTTATVLDFTSLTTATYGANASNINNGINVMVCGNTISDGQLKYSGPSNDRAPILSRIGGSNVTATVNGYFVEDVNLDGTVKYSGPNNDRAPILNNIGGVNATNIRFEQLP